MCGRAVFSLSRARVAKVAGLSDLSLVPVEVDIHRYNLCPTDSLVCVVDDTSTHERSIRMMKWGIEPRFSVSRSLSTINARIETVSTSKLYGPLVDRFRCVVIVDGFYEWKQEKSEKIAYLIRNDSKVSERPILSSAETHVHISAEEGCVLPLGVSPLLFAAIYDDSTVSILTTDSIGPCAAIHSRMPVLLSPESAQEWLSPASFESVFSTVFQSSRSLAKDLVCIQVSSKVNSVANKGIELTEPIREIRKRSFEAGLGKFFTKKPR